MGPSLWASLWNGQGRRPALRCGPVTWTFDRLFAEIRGAEAALRARGVGPGDLATILSLNTPETVAAVSLPASRICTRVMFTRFREIRRLMARFRRMLVRPSRERIRLYRTMITR